MLDWLRKTEEAGLSPGVASQRMLENLLFLVDAPGFLEKTCYDCAC